MYRKVQVSILAMITSLLISACSPEKGPFLIVQMCLANKEGVTAFVDEMKAIATEEKMSFTDRSRDTRRELDATGYPSAERADGSPLINIGLTRNDGMGVGAGNLGLPGYQIAVGFSGDSGETDSKEFADRIVKRLERHWQITTVPAGLGAKPLAGCQ